MKQQGVNEEVLQLVKYHHQKPDGSGYPAIDDGFQYGISSQIIAAADKFSALTENRCYRKSCDREEAFEIIHQDVESGLISEEVFEALKANRAISVTVLGILVPLHPYKSLLLFVSIIALQLSLLS